MPGHPGPAFGRPECKLAPGIHALLTVYLKAWMAGIGPAMTTASSQLPHNRQPDEQPADRQHHRGRDIEQRQRDLAALV
jgi:hypothetical protein